MVRLLIAIFLICGQAFALTSGKVALRDTQGYLNDVNRVRYASTPTATECSAVNAQQLNGSNSASLQITGDFAIVSWYKATNVTSNWGLIFAKGTYWFTPDYALEIDHNAGGVLHLGIGSNASLFDLGQGGVTAGAWHFVAGGFDSATGTKWVRLDGNSRQSIAATAPAAGATGFVVGNGHGTTDIVTDHSNLAVFSRSLTDAELTWLYNGGAGRNFQDWGVAGTAGADLKRGLVSFWPLSEQIGTRRDVVGTNHLLCAGGSTAKNLFSNSQDFNTTSSWTAYLGTVGANAAAAPDGTTSAESFTGAGGYAQIYQSPNTSAASYTLSVYAKAGTTNYLGLEIRNGTNTPDAVFDLTAGTVTSGVGVITGNGSGWYRCSITKASTGGAQLCSISTNSAVGSIYLWGAQLEQAASVTAYAQTFIPASAGVVQITPLSAPGIVPGLNRLVAADVHALQKWNSGVDRIGGWSNAMFWINRATCNVGTGTTTKGLGGYGRFDGTLVNSPAWAADGININRVPTAQSITLPSAVWTAGDVSDFSAFTSFNKSNDQDNFSALQMDNAAVSGTYLIFTFNSGSSVGNVPATTRNSTRYYQANRGSTIPAGFGFHSVALASTSQASYRNGALISNDTGLNARNAVGTPTYPYVAGAGDLGSDPCLHSLSGFIRKPGMTAAEHLAMKYLYQQTIGSGITIP